MNQNEKQKNFWSTIPKPCFVMAPMADVTDVVFRELVAKYSRAGQQGGGPDVFWSEFVSVDGLCSVGKEALLVDLRYTEHHRPIVAQIFGSKSENFTKIVPVIEEMGFDGIDINMGCPDRSVNKQGAGAALCKTPELAQEIVRATMAATTLPVSVKTRIGWDRDDTEHWIGALLETKPAVISIHARTRKDMSKVLPKWEAVTKAVELRDRISPETFIIANGGIRTHTQGEEVCNLTGCDGVMMGKALFGNPWLFDREFDRTKLSVEQSLSVLLEHTKNFLDELGDVKNFAIMKKHYKAYCHGFPGAKQLRVELMETNTFEQMEHLIRTFLEQNPQIAKQTNIDEYVV